MLDFLKRFFGSSQERTLKKFQKLVDKVNLYDEMLAPLSDEELRNKTVELKKRYQEGESLDDMLPEAYAVVKNVCRRLTGTPVEVSGYHQNWDMVPYDVQVLGAIAMHKGFITEMQTGEGKTLTAVMPLYLNALTGKPVHLVTVNDYLAQRDCEWVGSILRWLGLTTGVLISGSPLEKRKEIYRCDVVYGTASEFGFDYLRDNSIATSVDEQVGRGFYFAIIDEVDSILIDEARTPLIISGPGEKHNPVYFELKDKVADLVQLQRELCNQLALEARRGLELFLDMDILPKDKKVIEAISEFCRSLWLVSKGMPLNRVLRRVREHPDLRAMIDKWDTYYHAEQNKEESLEKLSQLYIIVDEHNNDFELTDRGMQQWVDKAGGSAEDFVMMDMGYEYALIDSDDSLSPTDKINRKIAISEEDTRRKARAHGLRQLLRAHLLMERDVDYIVRNDQIVIIDEHTGRPQPGRRFSEGLHQAIEAKEHVTIRKESQTFATVTLQNFFRLYEKLAGMTGTAITESKEFKEIYNLYVLQVPTFKACLRVDHNDEFYMTEREKYHAIVKEIARIHAVGNPILIGTESVEVSEKLSRILRQNRIEHTVLNAKNHAQEAEIIAAAGKLGAVTVATNMAGRGTDIKLDEEAVVVGGLHVIGTSRHQSRRIDRQLRGRCARLGDPGSAKFFLSFEDRLMRLFASPKLNALIRHFRPPEGEAMSDPMFNKLIETAQKRVEARNYTIRKHTLEYDDVMNKQRQTIYAFRNDVLRSEDIFSLAKESIYHVALMIASLIMSGDHPKGNSLPKLEEWMNYSFPLQLNIEELKRLNSIDAIAEQVADDLIEVLQNKFASMVQEITEAAGDEVDAQGICKDIIRSVMIMHIDEQWKIHLVDMDLLRSEVGLRTVGQKDPLIEFKHESFLLFESLIRDIRIAIVKHLFRLELTMTREQRPQNVVPVVATSFQNNDNFGPLELTVISDSDDE
ncbi:preprotein translocase subunit SecA [Chlamydia psittaci]|uniref:preprotein translocase subunit SecA n=1 Tax=Chlamydia psittaci TaxID=83554 RepID=UPI00027E1BF3|nr:preprotein translocase subunit SecA [Chlamydia psittaci]EPJ33901.1 preprotein translocase, SecA subunit [Chlamydia psittaci 06-1683]EPP31082.1 preprotein translocase, SecA subunit [Chlamydia psittaci C1/97]AFS23452.1 preprotein translocase, SecA subunit [Chlamydia psittaci WS/RT/E30]EPP29800.1 preprotein translocase, SecA subunit [Chlamydia psittaci 08-2626_L3]USB81121.1 preprotein translocase subunit SecA [Chlamydia psittaci]